MRAIRAALAVFLSVAIPVRAETTTDPLWYLLSSYVLAPDEAAVQTEGDGVADAKGLASLQADLLLLSDGFESFRDESQVKESLARLEPRMSPELKPFFKDRASSLDAIYRTLAVTDYTWAQRFPEPPCAPLVARRELLAARDGLFQDEKGQVSPWLVSLLGPGAEGKSAEQALDQASSRKKLTDAEYEKRRAQVRRLTLALASDKAVGAARSKLYCVRAAVFEDLAAGHRFKDDSAVLASRATAPAAPEASVFVVVWNSRRAAATMLETKNGPVLVTDASIIEGTEHPHLFAFSEKTAPIALTATVVRRDAALGLAIVSYAEDLPRPALVLASRAPSKDELVTALGHTEVSGLWTKISGLVTKSGPGSFQTDAAVSADFSGGPVLDEAGETVGRMILRPADTEEGRWPVAVPAAHISAWLDGVAAPAAPAPEFIEETGTAAVLSRTRPSAVTEAGLGAWTIPPMGPPPPTPRGVCVSNCGGPSAPSRSYSSYSGGSSSSYDSGGKELGEALGKLGAVLILEGIPALFRGLGKLFKGKSNSPAAKQSSTAKTEPPPKPKPPDPVLTITVTSQQTEDAIIFTARVTANRDDLKLDNIDISFTVNKTESVSAPTNASGVVVLTVKNPPSVAAHNSLDEESAKHPQFTNASRITKQGACQVTLIGATAAVAVYVGAVHAPVVVMTAGGLALKAPKPALVKACLGIAGATTAAAAAACTSMLGEELSKPAAPRSESPQAAPAQRVKNDSVTPAPKGVDLVRANAESGQDDLKKAEQDNAVEQGTASPSADPGTEPPDDEKGDASKNSLEKPDASDRKLKNIVEDLYKGQRADKPIGSGSTADAIRHELRTKQQVGNRFHSEKGRQYVRALENWLRRNPNASQQDRNSAQALLRDLNSALGGK